MHTVKKDNETVAKAYLDDDSAPIMVKTRRGAHLGVVQLKPRRGKSLVMAESRRGEDTGLKQKDACLAVSTQIISRDTAQSAVNDLHSEKGNKKAIVATGKAVIAVRSLRSFFTSLQDEEELAKEKLKRIIVP